MSVYCSYCQGENSDQARFCMHCSRPLTQICVHCGAQNQPQARFCNRCGQPLLPVSSPGALTGRLQPAAMLVGRYRIVRKLGQGGMGAVYLADDVRLPGKQWAIKEMSDAALTDPTERQRAIEAFRREAQMLAHLDHPNLPKVTDCFSEGGNQYLVMEYVPGQTLEKRLEQARGPLPEREVIAWAEQLCDVLEYLHSRQPPIIFRDLKPGNVMAEPDGRVKLIDFGIARHFKPGKRVDTIAFGTAGYAPPEQYGKGQTYARSDIYALGATLHHLLTGRDPSLTPFQFERVRTLNPVVSPALDQAIARAVEASPGQRWQSAAEMRKALRAPAAPVPQAPVAVGVSPALAAGAGRAATPPAVPIPTPAARAPAHPLPVSVWPMAYAGYGRRLMAWLIDAAVVSLVLVLVAVMEEGMDTESFMACTGLGLTLAYYIWPTAVWGKTPGKKMLGIKVVQGDGSAPGWGRSLMRYVIGYGIESLLAYILIGFLGWLWPLWDQHKQTWHDKIAGTYVVRG